MSINSPTAETGTVTPETTSLNEPSYAGAPAGSEQLIPASVAPADGQPVGAVRDSHASRAAQHANERDYSLIAPPNYSTIVGGEAPSPLVSIILLLGLGGLIGAAVATAAGASSYEWWLSGALFVVVSTLLAGFISRSA